MRGCCIRHPWEPAYWLQRKPGCRLRTSRFVETSIASLLNGGQVWKKEVDVTTFLKDIIVVVVIVVVVVIACGINRVFVAHKLTSDRGYATHHVGLCQWVIGCQTLGCTVGRPEKPIFGNLLRRYEESVQSYIESLSV